MYFIIWQYQVKKERAAEFEKFYTTNGAWAELFKKAEGYLGTELLRDIAHADRYITIDRWLSSHDYESFLSQWQTEYAKLDAQCEGLTEWETLLGKWERIPTET